MYGESPAILGGIELGKRTRTPAAFFRFGVKVCHPSLDMFGRNDELDRPLIGVEAKIGYLPHTAGAICDVNLRAGFSLRHGNYWNTREFMRLNVPILAR